MKGLEGGEGSGHERGAGRRESPEPDPAAVAGGQCGKGILGVPDRGEHAGRVLEEEAGGVRRPDPPADALEELDAGLVLERAQLLAHRRGRVAQQLRGSRYRTGLDDRLQDLQTAYVDHMIIKSH